MKIEDITQCVQCGAPMNAEDMAESEEMPVRGLAMRCTGCDRTAVLAQVFFTDLDFNVVTDSEGGECTSSTRTRRGSITYPESCGKPAAYVVQRNGRPIEFHCSEHFRGFLGTAWTESQTLLDSN